MSESFASNLEAVRKRDPALALRLAAASQYPKISFKWKEESGGISLYEGQRKIDSSKPGFHLSPEATSVVFLEGFGLGANLQLALQSGAKSIIVIEPSVERFNYSLAMTHFEKAFDLDHIHWLVGLQPAEVFANLLNIFRRPPASLYMDDFSFLHHQGISPLYSGYFSQIRKEWEAVRNQIRRNYGSLEDSLLGLENSLKNRRFIENSPGIVELKNSFDGWPAIVVSAGPSLKQTLPKLKELYDKALFIANDATWSVLEREGLSPHFVCSLERVIESKQYFEVGVDSTPSFLVAYPVVRKEVIEAFPGKSICVYRDYGYHLIFDRLLNRGVMPSSSSVSHMCLRLADYLGCSTVVLVGQDLSYDPQSFQSHVDGISIEKLSDSKSEAELREDLARRGAGDLFWIPGLSGKLVPTSSTYYSFLKEFSWEATQLRSKIFNASEAGAEIPNIPQQKLEDVAAKWVSRENAFKLIEAQYSSAAVDNELDLKFVESQLKQFLERLTQLRAQSKDFVADSKLDKVTAEKVCGLLGSAKDELVQNPVFSAFVLEMNAREYLEIENQLSSSKSDFIYKIKLFDKWFLSMSGALRRVSSLL